MKKRLSDLFNSFSDPIENWSENYFLNDCGDRLRYGHAPALDPQNSRGTIIMTHGYGEHIELYHHAIRFYQERGFAVWMMEWQGHGKSNQNDPVCRTGSCVIPEDNAQPRGMDAHRRDLELFVERVVQKEPGKPVIMSSNSMGGHIGLLALQKNPTMFDGAVLSTPMFDIYRLGLPSFTRPLVQFLFNLAAKTPLADFQVPGDVRPLNAMTGVGNKLKDVAPGHGEVRREWNAVTRRKYADIQIDRPTPAWIAGAYETIVPSLKDNFLHAVKTPMLIGVAGQDNLIDNDAIRHVADRTNHTEIVSLPSAQHSLWFESNGNYQSWTTRIEAFLNRLAPAVAPPAPHAAQDHPALPAPPQLRVA